MSDPTYYYFHPIYGSYGINPPKGPHERTMAEHVVEMGKGSPKTKGNPYPRPMTREEWDKHPQKTQMDDAERRESQRKKKQELRGPDPTTKSSYSRKKP